MMAVQHKPADKRSSASAARARPHAVQSVVANTALQRSPSCACGGTCPHCQAKRSQLRAMDFSHRDHADAQADKVPEHSSAGGEFVAPPIQRKLAIGRSDDPAEAEADRIADQVMRMVEPGPIGSTPSQLTRKCAACENEDESATKLQTKRDGVGALNGSEAPPIVHEVLRSSGQPLDAGVRAFMEPRFGHDFSQVRVHTDTNAAASARAVNARAYTAGQDMVFGAAQFAPGTTAGRRLLAHELVHTKQQAGNDTRLGARPALIQRTIGDGHDLQSSRFAGDPILEACFDDERLLILGNTGPAVAKFQQALVDLALMDLRIALPRFGVDGIFGSETKGAVQDYQRAHGLVADGIIGPITMASLDAQFPSPTPTPTTPAPIPIPGPPAPTLPTPVQPPAARTSPSPAPTPPPPSPLPTPIPPTGAPQTSVPAPVPTTRPLPPCPPGTPPNISRFFGGSFLPIPAAFPLPGITCQISPPGPGPAPTPATAALCSCTPPVGPVCRNNDAVLTAFIITGAAFLIKARPKIKAYLDKPSATSNANTKRLLKKHFGWDETLRDRQDFVAIGEIPTKVLTVIDTVFGALFEAPICPGCQTTGTEPDAQITNAQTLKSWHKTNCYDFFPGFFNKSKTEQGKIAIHEMVHNWVRDTKAGDAESYEGNAHYPGEPKDAKDNPDSYANTIRDLGK